MATVTALPHWDMTPFYPSLESPEFIADFAKVKGEIEDLRTLFDAEHIDQQPSAPLDDTTVARFERVTGQLNAALAHARTVHAYIRGFTTTDSRNAMAQGRQSEIEQLEVPLDQLSTRYTAWLRSLDIDTLITRSPVAADHAHALRMAQIRARHLMSPAEEALATEMVVTGAHAWGKLYETLTSQIVVPITLDGQTQELPISAVRNLAFSEDRATRQSGYEAELAAWAQHATPIAAALNSVKGQMGMLSRKRGWDSPLDQALFSTSIDRATLDAMMTAARESFPDFRRYLHLKAQVLGLPRLAFYDLFAPIGGGERSWAYPDATAFVVTQFGVYSSRLSDFATRAFRENWVDAEPRAGKRGGAFCMNVRGEESRVLANFTSSYGGMRTLAHELGHGYHNLNLAGRTPLQRQTPMTLAETASIFCETLVRDAALKGANPAEQMMIIESYLENACQIVLDISSRFIFEHAVFDRRQQRELSIAELCDIMRAAQIETYGDGLDETQLHPYMWAAKPHYYSSTFYNFPYMFGMLFGLGLYAQYQHDPETFKRNYDDLLSSTGMGDAATLAARFGIDLRSPAFWRASLATIRADIDRFAQLVK